MNLFHMASTLTTLQIMMPALIDKFNKMIDPDKLRGKNLHHLLIIDACIKYWTCFTLLSNSHVSLRVNY